MYNTEINFKTLLMKKSVFILLPIFAFILLACGDGGEGTTQKTQPERVDDTSQSEKEVPKALQFGIGEEVKFGDYIISVEKVEDPFVDTSELSEFLKPEAGKKLVAVEVLYKNGTSDKQLTFNEFDWTLFDDEGYNYQLGFSGTKEPRLSSGVVNPGGQSRGWITFETLESSKNFRLQFSDTFLTTDNVEFELY
jgi:hypothetical protein